MTVIARRIASIPERSAVDTWSVISQLVAWRSDSPAREELMRVTGIACSLITDEALRDDPLVVFGSGPRVRIYCVYGDDAIERSNVNEGPLSFDATDGDWRVSLPCPSDDLDWVRRRLGEFSTRITARELGAPVMGEETEETEGHATEGTSRPFVVNTESFFRE
jgi:hypothetical protein